MREVDYAVFRYHVQEMLPAIPAWLSLVEDFGLFICGLSLWKEKFCKMGTLSCKVERVFLFDQPFTREVNFYASSSLNFE